MTVKKFPNEGVIGAEYATLEVEVGLDGSALFTPILGRIGVDAVREDIANMQPGDELPNLVLESASVQALIDLLQSSRVERELEPVQVVRDIVNGESRSPRYALWLTHNEIHLLHWALKTAESQKELDVSGVFDAGEAYASMRSDVVDNAAFENFVDKFDNVHRQARIDDGEESGVTSTPESGS